MKIRAYFVALLFCFITSAALAQDPAPLAILKQTSAQMLSALKQNKASLKTDPKAIYHIVNTVLLPHVDLDTMSRSVVGRNAWVSATPAQREDFKQLFTHQVIKTYSTALSSYQNEQVVFFPIRGGVTGNRVQVQSEIIRANGQKIPVSYRLVNLGGNWKVYDFSVEGVSIISSYRSQFAGALSQSGLTGLLTKMHQRYGQS